MRLRSIVIVGVVAYIAFLAATVPSTFVIARAMAIAPGMLQVSDEHGTLWAGHARALLASPGGTLSFDRIDWTLQPRELAAGRIAFRVDAAGNGVEAHGLVGRGFSSWHLANVDARIAATALPAFVPLVSAWHPEGTISLTTGGMDWNDDGGARGTLKLDWQGAAIAFSDVKPLGHYVVEASGDGGPLGVKLSSPEGPLRMTGQGSISRGRFTFAGEARGEGDAAGRLEPLLGLMGARRADGAHALQVTIQR